MFAADGSNPLPLPITAGGGDGGGGGSSSNGGGVDGIWKPQSEGSKSTPVRERTPERTPDGDSRRKTISPAILLSAARRSARVRATKEQLDQEQAHRRGWARGLSGGGVVGTREGTEEGGKGNNTRTVDGVLDFFCIPSRGIGNPRDLFCLPRQGDGDSGGGGGKLSSGVSGGGDDECCGRVKNKSKMP